MDAGLVLVVLAERKGADAALSHAATAAAALPERTICALHVRVDPLSTIMPTEEILSKKQEETLLREGEAEGAAIKLVYEAWVKKLPADLVGDWEDIAGTEATQIASTPRRPPFWSWRLRRQPRAAMRCKPFTQHCSTFTGRCLPSLQTTRRCQSGVS